jgi:uncharacterized protein YecT (DUF1311 family)
MKNLFLTIIICCASVTYLNAQTQMEMNEEALKSYKKTDAELGRVYQKIIQKYAKNTEFINALRSSERLWIQFRDAEVKMMYPASDSRNEYGSMYPLCLYSYLEVLTRSRVNQLSLWLKDPADGEGCSGSIGAFN